MIHRGAYFEDTFHVPTGHRHDIHRGPMSLHYSAASVAHRSSAGSGRQEQKQANLRLFVLLQSRDTPGLTKGYMALHCQPLQTRGCRQRWCPALECTHDAHGVQRICPLSYLDRGDAYVLMEVELQQWHHDVCDLHCGAENGTADSSQWGCNQQPEMASRIEMSQRPVPRLPWLCNAQTLGPPPCS